MSSSTAELRVRFARRKTCLSPPVIYFTDRSKAVLLLWIFYVFFSVLRLLCLCARLFICAAGKGLTSWLSFVVCNCEFVTFPLVSRVRCRARKLYTSARIYEWNFDKGEWKLPFASPTGRVDFFGLVIIF